MLVSNKRYLFLSLLLFISGISFVVFRGASLYTPKTQFVPMPTVADTPIDTSLEGTIVCLPHKDTSGAQTLECALGLQTDSGEYYVLDMNRISSNPGEYTSGERIKANGIITPIEQLSTDHWQKYNVQGIFSVIDSLQRVE